MKFKIKNNFFQKTIEFEGSEKEFDAFRKKLGHDIRFVNI